MSKQLGQILNMTPVQPESYSVVYHNEENGDSWTEIVVAIAEFVSYYWSYDDSYRTTIRPIHSGDGVNMTIAGFADDKHDAADKSAHYYVGMFPQRLALSEAQKLHYRWVGSYQDEILEEIISAFEDGHDLDWVKANCLDTRQIRHIPDVLEMAVDEKKLILDKATGVYSLPPSPADPGN